MENAKFKIGQVVTLNTYTTKPHTGKVLQIKQSGSGAYLYKLEGKPGLFFSESNLQAQDMTAAIEVIQQYLQNAENEAAEFAAKNGGGEAEYLKQKIKSVLQVINKVK